MRRLHYKKENFWRNMATRFVLVILTAAIIISVLPRTESARMHYDIGKPWMLNTVIAKFQFPVYKSDESLQAERDSLLKSFPPYYRLDESVGKKSLDEFAASFGDEGVVSSHLKYVIIQELHRIYETGVLGQSEYAGLSNDTSSTIRIIDGKEVRSVSLSDVFSTKSAYEGLFRNKVLADGRQSVQKYNLNHFIKPNLVYDKERSESEKAALLGGIIESDAMVMAGQKIIDKGEIVTPEIARVLTSLEREMMKRKTDDGGLSYRLLGQSLLVLILLLLFTTYLTLFRPDYFEKPRSLLMVFMLIAAFPVLVSLIMRYVFFSVYILPFAILPIFVRIFMDSRTAFSAHSTMVLLCAVAVKYQYEFIIVQLVAGLVAIYALRELSKRSQLFNAVVLVTLASALTYYALQLIHGERLVPEDKSVFMHFIISGVALLIAYPLMFLVEKLFGFTSSVTLFELSDTNKDLLRKLSEVAPGTFQHAIMVGNLASEIANRIGAKGLLVRTGALYHDIGKLENAVFFTENQAGVNPHQRLNEKESAKIIINHVTEGVKLAEQYNLPRVIKDFILTHHGTGLTKYFYIQYKNAHPDEDIDLQDFSYPGPNPFTREQAILMMADAVEAASRSLDDYTEENIANLVNKIIDGQVNNGAFKDCPITFHDISVAKQVLIERLKSIYHTRIRYPEEQAHPTPPEETENEKI